jgi:pyruvate/2-oxoglutarate dehydrogenase complex dihydrolipoamide dehydrogenase (E3) component
VAQYDFDVAVIGGGSAGLTASGLAASLGARTALIERDRLGGECTWSGCVPSKALIRAAAVAHAMRTADRYGIEPAEPVIDFRRVMDAMRRTRQEIYEDADAPERVEARGVEVVESTAFFVDPHTLELGGSGRQIRSRYFIICAGSSPVLPRIAGLTDDLVLTNLSLFELEEQPKRLLVLGAGPVGIEMAQVFRRFGSEVTVVEQGEEILPNDEPECAAIVRGALEREGVRFHLSSTIDEVGRDERGPFASVSSGDRWTTVRFDRVLVATGRRPNIDGLALEAAGVAYNERGITVNHSGQTSASHIYACGDIVDGLRFTHVAEDMAKTAVMRLLLKVPSTYERRSVPWVTFTDPESAHLGRTASELNEEGVRFETIRFPYEKIDRALTDRCPEGMIVLHISPLAGKLYGAHVVGARAGEMINEFSLAMRNNLSLRDISNTVHAYPTYLLGARRAADQWYVRQASSKMVGFLQSIFGYHGNVPANIGTDEVV